MWEIRKIISVRGLRRKFAKAVQSQLFWDIKIALYQICALLQWREGKAISIVRLCDWRIEMGCTRSESQLLKEDKLYWTKDSTVLLVIMRSLAKKEWWCPDKTRHSALIDMLKIPFWVLLNERSHLIAFFCSFQFTFISKE